MAEEQIDKEQVAEEQPNLVSLKAMVDGDVKYEDIIDITPDSKEPEGINMLLARLAKTSEDCNVEAITISVLTRDGSGMSEVTKEEFEEFISS